MNKYFFIFLCVTTFSIFCMDEDQNDPDCDAMFAKLDNIYGTPSSREEAWEWLQAQDILKTINILGPKLEKAMINFPNGFEGLTTELRKSTEKEKSTTQDATIAWCRISESIQNCEYRAYGIKKLFDSEEPDLNNSSIQYTAAFCIKFYKANKHIMQYIKKQEIQGECVKITFKKNNSLNPIAIWELFKNAFPVVSVGRKNQE